MCLFFTISFTLLGYKIGLSIFLGVIGGLAFSLVVTWWNNTELPPAKVEETTNQIAEKNQHKLITKELPKEPERKAKSPHKNQPKALSLLNWLFRAKG
jgi:uncharacterized membrane protein YagU involved in acid resistance